MARDRGGTQYGASRRFRSAAAGHRRYVQGDRAFRKLLRNLPDAAKDELIELLEGVGDEVAALQRAETPSSRIRGAISRRVSRASLRLRVGLIGRPINKRLFFARILEGGRKARTVMAVRRGKRYPLNVRAMAAHPAINKPRSALRALIGRKVAAFWDGTMARAGQGADDA